MIKKDKTFTMRIPSSIHNYLQQYANDNYTSMSNIITQLILNLKKDVEKKMKTDIFFIYETINLINGMKYRGIHKTKNINDKYLGSFLFNDKLYLNMNLPHN